MNKLTTLMLILIVTFSGNLLGQSKKEEAYNLGRRAIKLMDNKEYKKSIELLNKAQKLDPKNVAYPYEIALAYTYMKKYDEAIKILEKLKKDKKTNKGIFQLLGNVYSMSGNVPKALKTYDEGLKKFPNSGNLYLEKGNVYMYQEEYGQAIGNYEAGVQVDPGFTSNYYRLALLFLRSNDKVAGLIYGEIFMNLERTTPRTREISNLLYETYNEAIQIYPDSTKFDFCDIIIDASSLEGGDFKLPYCAIFGKHMALATIGVDTTNLSGLSTLRSNYINSYFQGDQESYPNILFDYHKKMMEANVFDAYNHYLLQIGSEEEFDKWREENEANFKTFVDWYTEEKNALKIDKDHFYIRTQY